MRYLPLFCEYYTYSRKQHGIVCAVYEAQDKTRKIKICHNQLQESINSLPHALNLYIQLLANGKQSENQKIYQDLVQKKIQQRQSSYGDISERLFAYYRQQSYLGWDTFNLDEVKARFQYYQKKVKESKILDAVSMHSKLQAFYTQFYAKVLNYAQIYHISLQELLEGRREVMQDENFKFEDGKTVKDKMNEFEKSLREKMPKFRGNK